MQATPREKLAFHLKKLLRAVYPHINAVYYFSNLFFNLAYLFDKSSYHNPLDFLIGIRMRRLTEVDHVRLSPCFPCAAGQPADVVCVVSF